MIEIEEKYLKTMKTEIVKVVIKCLRTNGDIYYKIFYAPLSGTGTDLFQKINKAVLIAQEEIKLENENAKWTKVEYEFTEGKIII